MVDQTDRLALDTYAQGEDNWDHTDTVELFDELAIDKGAVADRPASGSYDDQFFYATDQRTLWRWDAGTSDWNAAAGLGASGDPIPGTSFFENVDAGSLNTNNQTVTESLDATGLTQGTASDPVQYLRHGSGSTGTALASASTTVTADNSTTDIHDFDASTSGWIFITGKDQDGSQSFIEVLTIATFATGGVFMSASRDSPGPRSYSRTGSTAEIAIDGDGSVFDVNTQMIGGTY